MIEYRTRGNHVNPFRTLEDDLRDRPQPVDEGGPHVHFHEHGGKRHAHEHVHPDEHAHSALTGLPPHP